MDVGVKVSPEPDPNQQYYYQGSRIGDFSGITVDPSDPTTFWAVNEYALAVDPLNITFPNWGTWIANFSLPAPIGVGSISGEAFNDLNGDGRNENDPGLNGVTIDYVSSMQGSGFTFTNPNATGGCGCGSSFTA